MYEDNLKDVAELGEDLMKSVDVDRIDDVGDERLDDTALAAVHRCLLDLLGQADRVHGGHGAVRVDRELLVARVRRFDALQARVLRRTMVEEAHHFACFARVREVYQRLLFITVLFS